MKLDYSDSIASKLVLPLFSALLLNQLLMSFTKLVAFDWIYLVFLLFVTAFFDIIEQARTKANAPMFVTLFTVFIVYLISNLIFNTGKGLAIENLMYVEGELVRYIFLLVSVYWGISHGNMLSKVRAFWQLDNIEITQGTLGKTQATKAFSPPSMITGLRRVLFLGLAQHLAVRYFDLSFYFLIAYWFVAFLYIALLQRWGLAINIESVGLKASMEYRSLWFKSMLVFLLIVGSLSFFMPRGIFTIREGVITNTIVNLLENVHYGTSHNRQQESEISYEEPIRTEPLIQGEVDFESPPTFSRWMILIIFLLQVLIVVVIPGIAIAMFIGFLLYSLVASEYHKLSGLPKIFVVIFLWFKRLITKNRITETSVELLDVVSQKPISRMTKVKTSTGRTLFYRLIRICSDHGLKYKNSLTPFEYEKMVQEKWPEISYQTDQIVKEYVVTKYGRIKSNHTQRAKAEEYLRQIGKFFNRLKGENATKKQEIPRL